MAFQPQQGTVGPASTGSGPEGPASVGGAPAARLSVTRNGDILTATAAVPVSLQSVMAKGFSVLLPLYFVSFAWRAFSALGRGSVESLIPSLLLIVFGGFAAVTSGWGLAMAFAGRVTVTFDRSRIVVVQEAFGRMRRAKEYSIAGIADLGVSTGRISKASQQARFDGLFGQSRPATYLGFHFPLGAVALFPGLPERDLLALLGQVRAHYAMLGVDIDMAQEQPGEPAGKATVSSLPDQATEPGQAPGAPPAAARGNDSDGMISTPPLSDQPVFDPEAPPR